ncbi:MAG: hypothetical protein HN919_15005 [Verrucomicrobia bacterium]|jgi:hypothetical protein|nr:hypothetical protein [Verrucomicrobiota bacterium]MBT7067607.1 hypothetical protein [Verrucomicrobiota bacterium]MBT7700718.1 hypothetical protein [Verrucomicrobiota bacterium]
MKVRNILLGTLCVALVGASIASAKEGEKKDRDAKKKDPAARAAARFKAVDKDGNGAISLPEFKAAHEQRIARMKKRMGDKWDPARAAKHPTAEVIFAKIDTDKSTSLSADEMKAAHKRMHARHKKGPKGKRDAAAKKAVKAAGDAKVECKAAKACKADAKK